MKQKIIYICIICIFAVGISFLFVNSKEASTSVTETEQPQIANPASVNCVTQGGKIDIKKRGDGGEYGVCAFEDNRWCEEWALLRGECPVGGRKIIGYDSEDQVYCAILGGTTLAEPNSKCTFLNGKICSTIDLFNGICSK